MATSEPQDLALELRGAARSVAMPFRLARRAILAPTDLALARGRTLGVVGPNGSGKTTLLRLLAGIDRPSAGSVRVLGLDPGTRQAARRVGYLAEDSRFPPELGARAALELLGSLAGMSRAELARASGPWLARVGLAEHARARLATFSRGMLRRFGLAQAFLHAPELVLLDEPTAGLDAQGFVVLDELLLEARARGAAVVLASHLSSDLQSGVDELVVLVGGRVVLRGAPERLFAREGRLELAVDGLAQPLLGELRGWIEAHGARLADARPARRGLGELYRSLAGEEPRA